MYNLLYISQGIIIWLSVIAMIKSSVTKGGLGWRGALFITQMIVISGVFSLVVGVGGYTSKSQDNTPLFLALFGLYSVIIGRMFIQSQDLTEGRQEEDLRVAFITQISDSFEEYCKKNIQPLNKIWDQNRISYLNVALMRLICYLILLLISVCLEWVYIAPYVSKDILSHYIFIISPYLFMAAFFWVVIPLLNYNGTIKSQVYPVIFNFWSKHCIYTFKSTFDARNLQDFVIIPSFTRQSTQDEIKGIYNGVDFLVVNSNLHSPSPKNLYSTTIKYAFHGLFMMFKINKKFSGKTVVTSRYKDQIQELLPSIQLSQGFQVYTTDPEQEQNLFGNDFADKLINIQALFEADSIEASFYDQKLLLKINTDLVFCKRNYIFDRCNFIEDANEVFKKMQLVLNSIDLLGSELH